MNRIKSSDIIYNYKTFQNNKDNDELLYLDDIYNYDVLHYEIHIDVTDTIKKEIKANVIINAVPTISNFNLLLIDLENSTCSSLIIDSIIFSGKNFLNYIFKNNNNFSWLNSRIRCTLQESLTQTDTFNVNVYYHGKPCTFLAFYPPGGLFFNTHKGTSIVESTSEPESAHFWWPCKDVPNDKALADIYITTWNTQLAASNGLLQSKTNIGGNKTVHWWKVSYPINPYLIAISVTNYTLQNQSYTSLDGTKSMPIQNFVFPEKADSALVDFSKVPEMIHAMALRFGEYPFINEKYGNAMVTYPGMEHQTISAMGAGSIDGTRASEDWLVFHELAHHWLGDQVSCATWNDTWLNEGGATFMESLWEEYKSGENAYINHMKTFIGGALDVMLPIYSNYPPFEIYVYYKGAWVYHMLRYFMGDSLFFGSMKKYLNESPYSYSSATTEQFFDYMQVVSGIGLEKFKNQWVYKAGNPDYGFAYNIDNSSNKSELKIQVRQMQNINSFPVFYMPIPVHIRFNDGTDSILVLNDSLQYQVFTFNFNKKINTNIFLSDFNYKEKILCTKSIIDYNAVDENIENDFELLNANPGIGNYELTVIFNTKTNSNLKLSIYNLLGNMVAEKLFPNYTSGNHCERLDLNSLPGGFYTVVLSDNIKRKSKKFIISK